MKTLTPRGRIALGVACGLGISLLVGLACIFSPGGPGNSASTILNTLTREWANSTHSFALSLAISFASASLLFLMATFFIHRSTREGLRRISEKLGGHAHRMAESAFHVSSSVKVLSGEMIEETTSLFSAQGQLKRIGEIGERNRLQAVDTQDAAGRQGALVTQGFREMQAMIRLLDEAGWAAKAMRESMALLDASTEQLSKIIRMVEEIALLARNTAVASARQESQESRAPLAEQVLKLAEQSARVAHEVSTEIANAVLRGQEASGTARRAAQSIEALKSHSLPMNERWTEALTGARDLFRCGSQAVRAATEESAAVEQLRQEVARVDRELQTKVASSEAALASARDLNIQAYRLREALKQLTPRKAAAEGKKAEEPLPTAAASQEPANPSAIILWKPKPLAESETGQPTTSRRFGLRFEGDGLDGL